MSDTLWLSVAKDFSEYPAGRYKTDGPNSAERFREEVLIPAMESDAQRVDLMLDGPRGYPSSFLEEAFGGMVRLGYYDIMGSRLHKTCNDQTYLTYVTEIWQYIDGELEAYQ